MPNYKTSLLKYFLFCFLGIIIFSCGHETTVNAWKFKQVNNDTIWYPATVPGTVHTDLLANNLIPDPFINTNELDLQWIEEKDWEYKTTFQLASKLMQKEHIEINFEGLDTYADVYLNDSLIISADNMHRAWKTDIKSLLINGFNSLYIRFKSPVKEGQKKLEQLPYYIPASNEAKPIGFQNSIFTRKAQYHYGWDWGPRLTTSGIWRLFSFKGWNSAKIETVKIETQSIVRDTAVCMVTINTKSIENVSKEIIIKLKDVEISSKKITEKDQKLIYEVKIPNPKLWWPNGMGKQYLYNLSVDLKIDNKIEDTYYHKIGIRKVELIQSSDSLGNSFYLKVNGKPLFMKGSNYIPSDFFNPRASKNYKRVIQDAIDANMNMLRVWGGAIYENDEFYSLCDEKGILIWQDFMFACAMVPTQESHINSIKEEAKEAIQRLNNHPSIALWCGNNENLTGWKQWDWQNTYNLSKTDSLTIWNTYDTLFNHTLKNYVSEYGNNNYWASSPSSNINTVQNKFSGDQHEWGVWFNQLPFKEYTDNAGRFISEYGLQSFPELNTIKKFDSSINKWNINTPTLNFRQRSKMPWISEDFNGFDMINYYIDLYFPSPNNLEELIYLSQLSQALSLQSATEAHRRNKPYTMGSLYWQIDDVWPTISWSTVDYFGNWKAAHYAIREANKPIIVSAEIDDEQLNVYLVSDILEGFSGMCKIALKTITGKSIKSWEFDCYTKSQTNTIIYSENVKAFLEGFPLENVFLEMTLSQNEMIVDESLFYFVNPKDLKLQKPNINIDVNGTEVTLTATSLAKNVYLSTGTIEGHFSNNYFDLIPEKSKTVTFSSDSEITDLKSILKIISLSDIDRDSKVDSLLSIE
ncbi:glycoside hydrolase family 2 protein [Flavobacteriaceae bacterium AU392]|nr:glycoside hydrolase family 2 protein [Flavobacteriaceae bacterium]RKM83500.1 glycoside hydrolase family 2 protein [Flavobacteriaceae bacterium AU392]